MRFPTSRLGQGGHQVNASISDDRQERYGKSPRNPSLIISLRKFGLPRTQRK
ncbi:hypothetical protein TCAL_17366 [Tigriopus californicus]|uniref:Uncharacterized protein n=1 Tax=Tigriopus californicus TaxID=6832 RepID=A0A553PBD6_TIGCA|nr:hypothetical protein TCAL_17366 [Tigriopus californicus]